jgi:hypothetical protein
VGILHFNMRKKTSHDNLALNDSNGNANSVDFTSASCFILHVENDNANLILISVKCVYF